MNNLESALAAVLWIGAYFLFGWQGVAFGGVILTCVFLLIANRIRLQIKEIEDRK